MGAYGIALTTMAGYATSSTSSSFQIKYPTYCGYNFKIAPIPTNSLTTIYYEVEKENENLGLNIYDKTKKIKVKEVFANKTHFKGTYSLTLETTNLATGVNLIELSTPTGPVSQTLQIIK